MRLQSSQACNNLLKRKKTSNSVWTLKYFLCSSPSSWFPRLPSRFIRRKKKKKRKSGDETVNATNANGDTTAAAGEHPRESEEMSKSMMTILVGYLDFDSVNIREVTLLGFAKLLLHDRIVSGEVTFCVLFNLVLPCYPHLFHCHCVNPWVFIIMMFYSSRRQFTPQHTILYSRLMGGGTKSKERERKKNKESLWST